MELIDSGSFIDGHMGLAMRDAVANGERVVLPLIAYYGTNRLRERVTASEAANEQEFETEFFSRTAGYKDCLDPSSSYKYFEKWFGYAAKADFDLRGQQREQMGGNYVEADTAYTPLIKAVAEAVEVVLAYSGWKNLRFSFVHRNLVMTHPDMGVLEISQLSDGVRSMIAMAADIAHRAVRLNAMLGREAVIKTPGLVLIDEVDLHLHPAWQQTVLESLLAAFPGIQFVVTTHSPQVISSVPDKCIRIIEDGQVFTAPKGTQGAESSRILKRVFGTELRPPANENTKLLRDYMDLVFADKWAEPEALAMRRRLDEIFSDEEPELTRADLHIENRQWELSDEES
jgi:predicted ATP-binding protein involved in virulence